MMVLGAGGCLAASDHCRPGLAFRLRRCSAPCVPTRKRAPEFFALSSRPASAKRGRTTQSLFTSSNVFSTSHPASSPPATSFREGAMAEAAAPVKGTRPEGAVSEADASSKVREMFTQIAPRYDLLNHLLSLQLDRIWRARTARRLQSILGRPEALVLDLCCGTGDLAFALAHAGSARIVCADFAPTLLVGASKKGALQAQPANQTTASRVPFFEADALPLPFPHASFDLVP